MTAGSSVALQLPCVSGVGGRTVSEGVAACRQFARLIAALLTIPLRRLKHGQPRERVPPDGRGIVLVQYETAMLDRLPLGHAQDWIEHSELPHDRIVYYFNRAGAPLTDAVKMELASRGFGWIDYDSPVLHASRPLRTLLGCIARLLAVLPL